jgi:tRNA dimethylallyltransferase
MKGKINIICGTTACGKTKYAVELAKKIDAEVINADSMQVYKEFPILSAQPTDNEMQGIPHHLYGIISCQQHFDVAQWVQLAIAKIRDISARGKTPLLVGGTGMYIKSLVYGIAGIPTVPLKIKEQVKELGAQNDQAGLYKILQSKDMLTAQQINPNDPQRTMRALEVILATNVPLVEWHKQVTSVPFPRENFHLILLSKPREIIYNNINQRFTDMLQAGALDEVHKVFEAYGNSDLPKAHGLPELIRYIKGEMTLEQATIQSQQNIRNYAKRQTTWFKNQLDFDETIEV